MSAALLLAHGGGWDEAAFIALPVALFGGLLIVANKRAEAMGREGAEHPQDPAPADSNDEAEPDAAAPEEPPS